MSGVRVIYYLLEGWLTSKLWRLTWDYVHFFLSETKWNRLLGQIYDDFHSRRKCVSLTRFSPTFKWRLMGYTLKTAHAFTCPKSLSRLTLDRMMRGRINICNEGQFFHFYGRSFLAVCLCRDGNSSVLHWEGKAQDCVFLKIRGPAF